MPIYKRYVRNKHKFKQEVEEAYKKFLDEIKRLREDGNTQVTTDTLTLLIKRHTSSIADKKLWDRKARGRYFKFFIKRAERAGIIEFVGKGGVWKIVDGKEVMEKNEVEG